jgi:isoleucyl-tRNA synthetase
LEPVKEVYLTDEEKEAERVKQGRDKYLSVDERIAIQLKTENKAFNVQKFDHSYPHCWRTDKPVLYYPLDSWFIKTTAVKDKLIALNKTIQWKPESTGTGRFGKWTGICLVRVTGELRCLFGGRKMVQRKSALVL